MRTRYLLAATATALAVAPAAASAHVTVSPAEGPADGFTKLDFGVPHGCDGSSTDTLRVQIPEGVVSVKPQVVAGWEVSTKEGKYAEPVELHGETVSEGVKEVTWRGGPLKDENLQVFGMSVKLPPGKAGDKLYFPTIQECAKGETAWIQIPEDDQSEEELDEPAPALTLTAAEGEHGAAEAKDEAAAEGANASSQVQATDTDEDEGPSEGLAWAGVALGGLGLLAGGAGLAAARRNGRA
jgi:uncharacterized protein YcnI